jgi:hypothetical protein
MQKTVGNSSTPHLTGSFLLAVLLTLGAAGTLRAQSFSSGSTGADGDLIINTPGVTTFTKQPVGGGSVYNFKTIQIAAGSTLQLSGASFTLPLYFLAQGAVTVDGTIDLSGQNGTVPTASGPSAQRVGPTVPGAGGYGGGTAAFAGNAATPGLGPAGGSIISSGCGNAYGANGGFSGNQFLVPLVGGSGGGGGPAASGGAGGGAILIASSVSVTVTGTITANGGGIASIDRSGGGGAGGGIRLVAPLIAGSGTITAAGGIDNCSPIGNGNVRLESFQFTFSGSTGGNLYLATPFNLFLPAPNTQPSIMVTSIGGVDVPANPTGSFTVPDVTLNSSSPLPINIQATNIPAGTKATVYFYTESYPNQVITSTPLAATSTTGVTTATATVTLNPGFSKGFVTTTWTQ